MTWLERENQYFESEHSSSLRTFGRKVCFCCGEFDESLHEHQNGLLCEECEDMFDDSPDELGANEVMPDF